MWTQEYLLRKIAVGTQDECWMWVGTKARGGYGKLGSNNAWKGGKNTQTLAHRAVYSAFKGPIPEGLVVRHSCDTPLCCNPSHLLLGTQQENLQDMHDRGRARGNTLHHPKILSDAEQTQVRDLFKCGIFGVTHLADLYCVGKTTIRRILKGASND